MLNDLLLFSIVPISLLLFVMAFSWKKKHFIKGLYVDNTITFICVYIFIVILTLAPYLLHLRYQNAAFIYALFSTSLNFCLLLMCISSITTCVYLKNTILIYTNMFVEKKIDLKGNDVIFKEKIDKKIVISKHFRITISARYLSGDMNYLCYQIKAIINH